VNSTKAQGQFNIGNSSALNQQVAIQEKEDTELVELCKTQLPYVTQAFEELVRRYEPVIFNTCRSIIGSREDAEEVCQMVFLKVFNNIAKFQGRSSFKTWLFRITYNTCLTRRASLARKNERKRQYISQYEGKTEAMPDDDVVVNDFGEGATANAIAKLNEDDREILVLRFISELALNEIADAMELKLSAAKMRLYRAMDRFKEVYVKSENP